MGPQTNGLSFNRQACSEEDVRFWEESRSWLPGPRGCLRGKKAHVFWDLENVPLVWLHNSYVLSPNKHFSILSRVFREYLGAEEFEITFYISDHSLKCQKESWSSKLPGSAINGLLQDLFQIHPNVYYSRPLGSGLDGIELKPTSHSVDEFMKRDIQKATARFTEGDVVLVIAGDKDFRTGLMELQAARRLQVLLMTRDYKTTSQQWWDHMWAGGVKWHCYFDDFMKWHWQQIVRDLQPRETASQVESAQVPTASLKPTAQPGVGRKIQPSCMEAEEPQVTRVLYVHAADVKFFMGPQGCIHQEITRTCGCMIKVIRIEQEEDRLDAVLVRGSPEKVDGGVQAIKEKLGPQHTFPWSLIKGYYFNVPFKQARPLLADRGEYIRALKEQTGADIVTEQDEVPGLPNGMKVFRIHGDAPEAVKRACQGMQKRLADATLHFGSVLSASSKPMNASACSKSPLVPQPPSAPPPPAISSHNFERPQQSYAAAAQSYLSVASGTHRP